MKSPAKSRRRYPSPAALVSIESQMLRNAGRFLQARGWNVVEISVARIKPGKGRSVFELSLRFVGRRLAPRKRA